MLVGKVFAKKTKTTKGQLKQRHAGEILKTA